MHPCDDGVYARALMRLPRYEDTSRERMVWPDVAELSLLGGLGCGKMLVEHALQKCQKQGYRFVVLQSTKVCAPPPTFSHNIYPL